MNAALRTIVARGFYDLQNMCMGATESLPLTTFSMEKFHGGNG